MTVRLVNDSKALLSMRESDFDAYSAYGEVIDNSIDAKAENIKLHVEYDQGTKHEAISWMAFGDDGHGMNEEMLHRCLQLGYSSDYNRRQRIGRFGVGATLAAINQCQRVDIYSKTEGKEWLYTYIDIEEILKQGEDSTGIPEPVNKKPPKDLMHLTGTESGTVVIWTKYDRQPHKASRVIEEAHEWIGRTYRYFIGDGIKITLNGQNIKVVDPLYASPQLTRYPEDPAAHCFDLDTVKWPVPQLDRLEDGPDESVIEIQMSLLPKKFRPTQGSGNTNENRNRYIHHNEGISIIRNKREVFYGRLPYWPGKTFEEIDRWWGCEIRFNAVLDRAFTVKNIKQGAVPTRELKKTLADRIEPTRKTALEHVREIWDKYRVKQTTTKAAKKTSTGHESAETTAQETKIPKNVIDKRKDPNSETREFVEKWRKDADEKEKAAWREKFKNQPFTIIEDEWKGPHFFETYHMGGSSILSYNNRHVFFEELGKIREELSKESEENPTAKMLRDLIDILIMSYGKAEAMFDSELEMKAEDFSEQLRSQWGNYLKNYIQTWRERSQ